MYALVVDGSSWPDWSAIDSYEVEPIDTAGDHGGPAPGAATGDPSALLAQGRALRVFRTGSNVSRERIVELVPDRRLVYEMVSGSGLLRDYRGQIDVDPEPTGGTRVRWRATWRSPFPGVGWLMQRYLRGFQQRMVDGLAAHADREPDVADPTAP